MRISHQERFDMQVKGQWLYVYRGEASWMLSLHPLDTPWENMIQAKTCTKDTQYFTSQSWQPVSWGYPWAPVEPCSFVGSKLLASHFPAFWSLPFSPADSSLIVPIARPYSLLYMWSFSWGQKQAFHLQNVLNTLGIHCKATMSPD